MSLTPKHLKITYGEQVLYDGPVEGTLTWSESPTLLSVQVSQPKPSLLQQLQESQRRKPVGIRVLPDPDEAPPEAEAETPEADSPQQDTAAP